MALMNTKRSMILLKDGATLPTVSNFLEVESEFVVNPVMSPEEFARVSGNMGSYDSYIDTNKVTFEESLTHMMRTSNKAGDALETPPEYGELLKVCGLKETITGIGATGLVTYANTQSPTQGSAVIYVDGKKNTLQGSVVGDLSMTFEAGMAGKISASMKGYYDNKGIPTNETNPSVTLSTEDALVVTTNDIITAGGTTVKADSITLTMNAQIDDFYGFGIKEFNITDYNAKLEASFYVDGANYSNEITKLVNQTIEAISIQLSSDDNGALVDGKSVKITADFAKASSSSDSIDKNKIKRTFVWLLQLDTNGESFQIIHGNVKA